MDHFLMVFSRGASSAPTNKQISIFSKLREFLQDEEGIATAWAIFWMIICFAISGLSIDVTNAWKVRQILQTTADVTAHAGAIELRTVENDKIEAVVEVEANKYAALNMNESRYGDVLFNKDILVGYWDDDTRTFVEMVPGDELLVNAVRTITRQNETKNTAVGTFFLRFVGFKQFEIATAATVKIFGSRCSFDGIFAAGSVDLSTQQTFLDEYCIHGETGLKMSGDNYFGSGTTVSTPHFENCGPTAEHCSEEVNPGFKEAFEELSQSASNAEKVGAYIDIIMNGYSGDPDLLETNAYIANLLFGYTYDPEREILNLAELPPLYPEGEKYKLHTASVKEPLDVRELESGKINIVTCAKNGFNVELGFENEDGSEVTEPLELDGIIVVGDGCDFVFDRSVTYTNAILATNATGTQTFSGNSGVTLGENDGCKPGNEVTLITQGSVSFASKLSAYDLDIIATKNVHLASKANDPSEHIGTNINALGDVQITTKHTFRGCEGNTVSPFGQKLSYAIVQ